MDSSTLLEKIQELNQNRRFQESLRIIDDFLVDLDPSHKQLWIKLLIRKSKLLLIIGDANEAEKTAQLTLHLAKMPPENVRGKGWALIVLGQTKTPVYGTFRYKEALEYFNQALAIFEKISDQRCLGILESLIGLSYYVGGDIVKADKYARKGSTKVTKYGNNNDIAVSKIIYGIMQVIGKGEIELSESLYREAVVLSEQSGNTLTLTWALHNLGLVLNLRGDISGAIKTLLRGVAIMEKYELKITNRLILGYQSLVDLYLASNDHYKAQVQLEKFRKVMEESKTTIAETYYNLNLGRMKLVQNELGSALEFGMKAKDALTRITYNTGYIFVIKFRDIHKFI